MRITPGRALLLTSVLIAVQSCASTPPIDRPLRSIHASVSLELDWQVSLVDNGLFPYSPTQLGRIGVSPDGRRVFVGTSEGLFFSINSMTGDVQWQRQLGEAIDGEPAVYDGVVYVGANDGNLYAIDAAGGSVRWRYETGGNLDSRAAVADELVFFSNNSDALVALDIADGTPVWTHVDDDPVLSVTRGLHPPVKGQGSPTLVGERSVVVGFPNGRLARVSRATGVATWTVDLANEESRHIDVDEPVVLIDGTLYASSFSGGLYALDPSSGEILWQRDLRGATRPVGYQSTILTTTVDGTLWVLNPQDGSTVFSLEFEDRGAGRIFLMGDYVLIPMADGPLHVVDASAPYIHTSFSRAGIAAVATLPDGRLVAFDHRGVLYGLTLRMR